jgi:hypothetical protein
MFYTFCFSFPGFIFFLIDGFAYVLDFISFIPAHCVIATLVFAATLLNGASGGTEA